MIVATLLEPGLPGLRAAIDATDDVADAFEIRLDALGETPDPGAIRALTPKPLIATCRRPEDGGTWRGPEEERLDLLRACLAAGFDHADVEGDTAIDAVETRLIRSRHALDEPDDPSTLPAGLARLADGGAVAKYAGRVRGFRDELDLLCLDRRLARADVPHAVMGLGDYPRSLSLLLGSQFVYGGGRRNAPFQPSARAIDATLARWGRPAAAAGLYLVVGDPVGHSLSPRMHNAGFAEIGEDAAYGALDVPGARDLQRLFRAHADLDLHGLSVTAPLKRAAWRLVDRRTDQAEATGSVNTVRFEPDGSVGHNTDGLGARRVLDGLAGADDGRVLLIGAGGAARGLLPVLGPDRVDVASRRPAPRRELADAFGCGHLGLDDAGGRLEDYGLLINATSVEEPLVLDGYEGPLFDLHYAEEPTAWERHAAVHHNAFAGGRDLLLAQGVFAFEFWTGRSAPEPAMRRALEATP